MVISLVAKTMSYQPLKNNNYNAFMSLRQAKYVSRPRRRLSRTAAGHPQASHHTHFRSPRLWRPSGLITLHWLGDWRLKVLTICLLALSFGWWLTTAYAPTFPSTWVAMNDSLNFKDEALNFLKGEKLINSFLNPLRWSSSRQSPPHHSTWRPEQVSLATELSSQLAVSGLNPDQLTVLDHLIKPYLPPSPQTTEQNGAEFEPNLLIKHDTAGNIEQLVLTLPSNQELYLVPAPSNLNQFSSTIHPRQVQLTAWQGQVKQSLSETIQQAGLPEYLFADLVKMFRWQLDLVVNSQVGDSLTLIYEQHRFTKEETVPGTLVAAEYIQSGQVYRALRYTDRGGETAYYTPQGENLRKTFLLAPVEFTRVSSSFGSRRHPIFHQMHLHTGMDYAAPQGTPVTAAGEGKVLFIGWKGGYGKTVILEHSEHYITLYGHFSRYAKGLQVGQRVQAEQKIGYVGQTGLATAPHLHFEFYVDGVYQPPQQANLPISLPIAEEYQADFLAQTKPLVARLEALSPMKSTPLESIAGSRPLFEQVAPVKPNPLRLAKFTAIQAPVPLMATIKRVTK